MNNRFLVTATRVIFVDDATPEELNAAKNDHPGKTIVRASTLYIAPNGLASHQTDALKETQDRVRKLERTVAMLVEAAKDIKPQAKVADVTETETVTETPKPVSPIAEKIAAKHNAQVQAEPKPVNKTPEPASTAPRARDKYDDYDKEELLRRVKLRGGNAKRIMGDLHARARTNALRDWLRVNPPKPKATTAAKPQAKASAKTVAAGSKLAKLRARNKTRRTAH
jgi:hypothetical protein